MRLYHAGLIAGKAKGFIVRSTNEGSYRVAARYKGGYLNHYCQQSFGRGLWTQTDQERVEVFISFYWLFISNLLVLIGTCGYNTYTHK